VALGGILALASMFLAQAAERLRALLRTVNKSESTHINRSPINPVHFI
jgi:hypothetical protein